MLARNIKLPLFLSLSLLDYLNSFVLFSHDLALRLLSCIFSFQSRSDGVLFEVSAEKRFHFYSPKACIIQSSVGYCR
jgi:hypothetical protein